MVGSFQGQFEKISASELGSAVITEALKRATLNPQDVDQVIMGQVFLINVFLTTLLKSCSRFSLQVKVRTQEDKLL
jgi:hypothetical protein